MENMENNNQKQIVSALIIAGVIIAGVILLKDSKPKEIIKTQNINKTENLAYINIDINPVNDEDHILGNKNAEIVIVEYSDTECPFCKIFHKTMQKVVQEKTNVAWVYRHFPIPQIHSKAPREAEATECAFEQGGNTIFWKYIDRLFTITPSNNGLNDEELTNIAQYIGLNTSFFYTCLESGKYKTKVEDDVNDGVKAGVKGTPFSFILVNGKVIDIIQGAQPYEIVIQKLDALK